MAKTNRPIVAHSIIGYTPQFPHQRGGGEAQIWE